MSPLIQILPVFIKTNTNAILIESLKNNTKNLKVTIQIGNLIDYKDRSQSLEQAYKQQFDR